MIQPGKPHRTMKYAGPMNLQISGQSSIVSERHYLILLHEVQSKHLFLLYRGIHNCCKFHKFAVVLKAEKENGKFAAKMRFIFNY